MSGNITLNSSGNSIDVSTINGEVNLFTSGGSIIVDDFEGILKCEASSGNIEMTGITGLMFGDRVDKMEAPGATSRLYEATKPDSGITVSPLAIKSEYFLKRL